MNSVSPSLTKARYISRLSWDVILAALAAGAAYFWWDWLYWVAGALIVWALFRLVPVDPMLIDIMVVLCAMPVATNGTMLCYQYGGDSRTMAQGTFVTTVLSIITIPILVMVIG